MTSGQLEGTSRQTDVTLQGSKDTVVYDTSPEFHYEEYDCGRGLPSKARKLRARFFHPTKVSGDYIPPAPSNNFPTLGCAETPVPILPPDRYQGDDIARQVAATPSVTLPAKPYAYDIRCPICSAPILENTLVMVTSTFVSFSTT